MIGFLRLTIVVVCLLLSVSVSAQVGPDGEEEHSPWWLTARLGYGRIVADETADGPRDPTLLFGSAYTGNTQRLGLGTRREVGSAWRVGGELGFARNAQSGFAETSDFRRELEFQYWTLDLLFVAEGRQPAGPVDLVGALGVGPRFALGLQGTERLQGDVPADQITPTIHTGVGLPLFAELGLAYAAERFQIPVTARFTINPVYPNTTEGRLDNGDLVSGSYRIDHDWSIVVNVGVDLRIGGAGEQPEPQPWVEPEVFDIDDADGDGFPDDEDACPIEPGTLEGCPMSGGRVQVTCEAIELDDLIYFESGSATIDARSFELLDLLVQALRTLEHVELLRIEGHTDSSGSARANQELSQRRAESVMDYLVGMGIDGNRLEAQGFGEEYPIAPNDDAEGRALNRRVDFILVESAGGLCP